MIKCDICGDNANRMLFTKDINSGETHCIAEICEKCAEELGEAVVCIANRRMRDKFGDKALTIQGRKQ